MYYCSDFNDNGELIDMIIGAPDVKRAFFAKGSPEWISRVDDEAVRAGLAHLSKEEISIIEDLLFRGESYGSLCMKRGMEFGKLKNEIRKIKSIFRRYM